MLHRDTHEEKPAEEEPLLVDGRRQMGRHSEPVIPPPAELYPPGQGHQQDHSSQVGLPVPMPFAHCSMPADCLVIA
jgi:hypothetical protein